MEISFENSLQIIPSNVDKYQVKINKTKTGVARVKVQAIGGSRRLLEKYPNKAIKSRNGDFFFEDQIITFGENETSKTIEIEIFNTNRTVEHPKDFKLNLVNEYSENYAIRDNKTCICYISKNVPNLVSKVVDKFLLPNPQIVQNVINIDSSGSSDDSGNSSNNSGSSAPSKIELKGTLMFKNNDDSVYYNPPLSVIEYVDGVKHIVNKVMGNRQYNRTYKIFRLDQFTPGLPYTFNYDKTSISSQYQRHIYCQILDYEAVKFAVSTFIANAAANMIGFNRWADNQTKQAKINEYIGTAKTNCHFVLLKDNETTFTVTPTYSHRIITFYSIDENYNPDTIGFNYIKSTNTFKLDSF